MLENGCLLSINCSNGNFLVPDKQIPLRLIMHYWGCSKIKNRCVSWFSCWVLSWNTANLHLWDIMTMLQVTWIAVLTGLTLPAFYRIELDSSAIEIWSYGNIYMCVSALGQVYLIVFVYAGKRSLNNTQVKRDAEVTFSIWIFYLKTP